MPYIKTLSTQLVSTYKLLAVYYDASQLKLELSSLSTYFKGHNTTVSMEEFLKHVPAKSLFSNKRVLLRTTSATILTQEWRIKMVTTASYLVDMSVLRIEWSKVKGQSTAAHSFRLPPFTVFLTVSQMRSFPRLG